MRRLFVFAWSCSHVLVVPGMLFENFRGRDFEHNRRATGEPQVQYFRTTQLKRIGIPGKPWGRENSPNPSRCGEAAALVWEVCWLGFFGVVWHAILW